MTPGITTVDVRVRYAETDQMGVAYHTHYLVWCEVARTDHLRQLGVSYRSLEERGLRLAVTDARIRYLAAARYDDVLRVRCWVRGAGSRQVVFGYTIERTSDGRTLAQALTTLIALDQRHGVTRLPNDVRQYLVPVADPTEMSFK